MKVMKFMATAIVAASLLSTSPAHSREIREIYSQCGLGGIVFGGGSGENDEIFAIITNITSDWGTSAILSHLISPDVCADGPAQAAAFIMQTYPSIERDLAAGEGEFLYTMLQYRGCEAAIHSSLITDMRSDMAGAIAVSGEAGPEMIFNTLEKHVDQSYSTNCMLNAI